MIKWLLEQYVRKTKSSTFSFDEEINTSLLLSFSIDKAFAFLRGLRMVRANGKIRRIFFGKSIVLFNKRNISIGNNVNVGDHVRLSALGRGQLAIGDNVNIGAFSQVIISMTFSDIGEFIRIGNNVGMGEFAYLGGSGGLEIGSDTIIGQYFSTHPENHNYSDNTKLIREQGVTRQGILIGSNCWIGAKVTILDGVTVGDNCVIAAGSIVTKSTPDNVVVAGVPAKVIRNR
ncbi:MAG: acyltransferase [Gammaproteobacteria bacterium]|nr:MAG: acyltransferase [Gammaproteobacteria bacterium]